MSYTINYGDSKNKNGQKNNLKKQPHSAKRGHQAPAFRRNLSTDKMMCLRYEKHYSYRQIAEEMGCSPSTIRNRISGKVASNSLWEVFHSHIQGGDTSEIFKQKKPLLSGQPVKRGVDAHAFRHDLLTDKMLYLRNEKNYSYRQIAREMGCSPSTVRKRLNDKTPF